MNISKKLKEKSEKKITKFYEMSQIILSEAQQEHFDKVLKIADDHNVILITSPTGCGKTIDVCEFIRTKNIKRCVVICNGSLQITHWNKHKVEYDLPIIKILSYDTLRGSSTTQTPDGKQMVSHGLLYKSKDTGEYEPSDAFKQYIEEGDFLLVYDECHLIKNACGKTFAASALSRWISKRNSTEPLPASRSYIIFSSMTPFDSPEHVINFVVDSGIISSKKLFSTADNKPTGVLELYNYCKKFNQDKTESIWGLFDIKNKNATDAAYKLTTEVLLPLISSFVKNCQRNYIAKQCVYFAKFDIEDEGLEIMKYALNLIKSSKKEENNASKIMGNFEQNESRNNFLRLNQFNQFPQFNQKNVDNMTVQRNEFKRLELEKQAREARIDKKFKEITTPQTEILNRSGVVHGMISVHTVKIYFSVLGFIKTIFDRIPNCKIVIFLSYKESINIIMKNLHIYNPSKITGDPDCPPSVRDTIISKFNEANLDSRLLLIISQIGSDGIELDDRDGRFPRVGLGFPDFFHTRFFQCPGRIYRRFTKSNSLFFWCLINSDTVKEESVFKSIEEKSLTMEETLRNNEILPPINYEEIINPHKCDLLSLLQNITFKENNHKKQEEGKKLVVKFTHCSISKNF